MLVGPGASNRIGPGEKLYCQFRMSQTSADAEKPSAVISRELLLTCHPVSMSQGGRKRTWGRLESPRITLHWNRAGSSGARADFVLRAGLRQCSELEPGGNTLPPAPSEQSPPVPP